MADNTDWWDVSNQQAEDQDQLDAQRIKELEDQQAADQQAANAQEPVSDFRYSPPGERLDPVPVEGADSAVPTPVSAPVPTPAPSPTATTVNSHKLIGVRLKAA